MDDLKHDLNDDVLLRLPQVLGILPISRSAWLFGIKKGIYPEGFLLSERTRVWRKSDILALIERASRVSSPVNPQAAE
jgi:prophage regulatory protein